MKLNRLKNKILKLVEGEYYCLYLFGSYSRGDFQENSDIDILQVVKNHRPSYSKDEINFSVYTSSYLTKMAQKGNLFILHLINDGKTITDKLNLFEKLKSIFKPLENYSSYRDELTIASKLLDVKKSDYKMQWKKLNSISTYFLRSYLYSKAYDNNKIIFSINELATYFDDLRISNALYLKNYKAPSYEKYLLNKKLLEYYTGSTIFNEFGSTEALVVNYYGISDLVIVFGLTLLNNSVTSVPYGDIEYLLELCTTN